MADRVDAVVNLSKRRGFVFPSSEIYGGTRSAWDYGPLGVELKENIRRQWWQAVVRGRDDVVGLDSSVILAPQVWEASGHVSAFVDPLTECKKCHRRWRADQLIEAFEEKHGRAPEGGLVEIVCTNCGTKGDFTEPRDFNGMLRTAVGPVEDAGAVHYLRPETAQGIFVNYLNVMNAARKKPPFGIGQTGKSFRNEITPGNFIFRTREFEQMEMEFFVPPDEWEKWYAYWREERLQWYVNLGVDGDNLRYRDHAGEELAHYATATADIEYKLPIGWKELEGVACRSDFDLKRHTEASGRTLEYFDGQTRERFVPWVIEPAAGVDRAVLVFLVDAYEEQEIDGDTRTVLHLHPRLAPIKVGVFPLVKKDGMPELAKGIEDSLRARGIATFYDQSGAIGRRYRRQDEVGTPWCITVDGETRDEGTVTLRDRDTMEQERVTVDSLPDLIAAKLSP